MKNTYKAYGIVSSDGELLSVYLDKVTAEMQLVYFQHRSPSIIEFKGEG